MRPGRQYAVYLFGGKQADLLLDLPAGSYRIEWLNPRSGAVEKREDLRHAGGGAKLSSPAYTPDMALRCVRR